VIDPDCPPPTAMRASRMSGLPFLDLGIVQSPMLHAEPTAFSKFLPGYGGSRVLFDGALT
jgi:hypothetical protein